MTMGLAEEIAEVLGRAPCPVRVYLAGPLEPDDWRSGLGFADRAWPGVTITGPFAWGPDREAGGPPWLDDRALAAQGGAVREELLVQRLGELQAADAVFAWFARRRAHWTAAEVALAGAYGIPVFAALCARDYPDEPGADPDWTFGDGYRELAGIVGLAGGFVAAPGVAAAWEAFLAWCRDPEGPVAARRARREAAGD